MNPPVRIKHLVVFRLKEVSVKTGLSSATLRKHLATGTLQGRKAGGIWWVSAAALRAFEAHLARVRKIL